jgi:hypothetical protein
MFTEQATDFTHIKDLLNRSVERQKIPFCQITKKHFFAKIGEAEN